MLRIHLCQLHYNPAYYDNGFDLLEEPALALESGYHLGGLRSSDAVQSLLIESRASYVEHINRKLRAIARWSEADPDE